ncbi:TIGR04283 family arsenosugar biosynthesis glycosyltransferase [Dasania marina]|uniref:TIGR04283 family arsenosugar biosynthesis glycosyltransferase n=1 Tax=Dasania marina TaxID=471499 RepID=UPI00036CB8F2|nr:TIGR04283 family arsenosugar biosynthesis glycosyltransferase [Dasania marina]
MNELAPALSIIMPVFNEATHLPASLRALQPLRQQGCELIIVDGGSQDESAAIAQAWADVSLQSAKGRALQMNAGAAAARGEYLLFLHADTQLPPALSVAHLLQSQPSWGFFKVQLNSRKSLLPWVQALINLRSGLTSVATGDQSIFVQRQLFIELGGYPAISLMEDVALCKQLRRRARPSIVPQPVLTSSRRWLQRGVIKTIALMWLLRLGYFLKFSPRLLHRLYYG